VENIFKSFKKIATTKRNKKLITNFLSLSVAQFSSYVLPLITVPYLVRVLGPDKFGLIAFAQAFIQYFIIITDYGFNLSATREISIKRKDLHQVSIIFSSVLIIKFLLFCLCFIILLLFITFFNKFSTYSKVYIYSYGMVLGYVIFPTWLFQGIEQMKLLSFLNILSRVIFITGIFIIVRRAADFIYVPVLYSMGYILAGVAGLWIVFTKFKIKFLIPHLRDLKHQIVEGWYIFISNIAISLYTISNTFILGLFTNNTIVGFYSAGEKIIKAAQGIIIPISRTLYPHISHLAAQSKQIALNFIRKSLKIISPVLFCFSAVLFIFADKIGNIILGDQYQESIYVIRILSFLPFITGISNILGIQTLLTFGLKKIFSKIIISGSLVNITLALILVHKFQHIGVSISMLVTEIYITIAMYINLIKRRYKIL